MIMTSATSGEILRSPENIAVLTAKNNHNLCSTDGSNVLEKTPTNFDKSSSQKASVVVASAE